MPEFAGQRILPFKPLFFNPVKLNFTERVLRLERFFEAFKRKTISWGRAILRFWEESREKGPIMATRAWIERGLFLRAKKPAFYIHEQIFEIDGKIKKRRGLLTAFKVNGNGQIFEHESVFEEGTLFHLNLMKQTRKNFEAVLMLYQGPHIDEDFLMRNDAELVYDCKDEYDDIHNFYRINLKERDIIDLIASSPLIIADGHHRFKASLLYREKFGFPYRLVEFVSVDDPNLIILPTHRSLIGKKRPNFEKIVAQFFEAREIKESEIREKQKELEENQMVLIEKEKILILTPKEEALRNFFPCPQKLENLAVYLFHKILVEEGAIQKRIEYSRDIETCLENVKTGKAAFSAILPEIKPETVMEIALNRKIMPPKSTDFYPKLVAGPLVFDLSRTSLI